MLHFLQGLCSDPYFKIFIVKISPRTALVLVKMEEAHPILRLPRVGGGRRGGTQSVGPSSREAGAGAVFAARPDAPECDGSGGEFLVFLFVLSPGTWVPARCTRQGRTELRAKTVVLVGGAERPREAQRERERKTFPVGGAREGASPACIQVLASCTKQTPNSALQC